MKRVLVALLLLACLPVVAHGQAVTLAAPSNVTAKDVPDDVGNQVALKWDLSPEDHAAADGSRKITGYAIYRKVVQTGDGLESGAETPSGAGVMAFADDFDYEANQPVGTVPYSVTEFLDENVEGDVAYMYAVVATGPGGTFSPLAVTALPVVPAMEYINQGKLWFLIIMLLISVIRTPN